MKALLLAGHVEQRLHEDDPLNPALADDTAS